MGADSKQRSKNENLSHTKDKCRICGKSELTEYINLGNLPMPNNLLSSQEEAINVIRFPLKVNYCNNCKLSQLNEVVDPRILFSHYVYKSGVSQGYINHCKQMVNEFKEKYQLNSGSSGDFLIDIAGNDCTLLEQFKQRIPGLRLLNIDPAKNLCELCKEKGIPAYNEFLTINTALEVLRNKGLAQVITATNVTAHVDNLRMFFLSAKFMLAHNGVFIIEFPYLVDTIEKNAFGQIYFEHLSYFLITPLQKLCEETGMRIIDVQKFEIHDGTCRVVITHDYSNRDVEASVEEFLNKEKEYQSINTYFKWNNVVKTNLLELNTSIQELILQGFKVAGFGASAKGNTMLNSAGLTYKDIMYIVDDTPDKQGLYSPGTGIPIVSVEELKNNPPDYVLILAPNFTKEIINRLKGIYEGSFIIPVPNVKII
jgi:hypothetical protein